LNESFFDKFHGIFTCEMQRDLFVAGQYHGFASVDPYRNANELFERSNARNFPQRMLYTDVNMDLVELLMKQDQMSMAVSVESRVPFLDHLLVEFAGTVPPSSAVTRPGGEATGEKSFGEILTIRHRVSAPKWAFRCHLPIGSRKTQQE